jgi:hypothetical protein
MIAFSMVVMRHMITGKLIFNHSSAKEVLHIDIKNDAYPFLTPLEFTSRV